MLDLARSDDDLAILESGKKIEESILDLKQKTELKHTMVLKNMNTHFLNPEDKNTDCLTPDQFKEYISTFIN